METSRPLLKPLLMVAGAALVVLILNAVAMQFTPEVSWGAGDFLVAGVLLFGAGSSVVVAFRFLTRRSQRIGAIVAIAVGLALVWAELAVGLFH